MVHNHDQIMELLAVQKLTCLQGTNRVSQIEIYLPNWIVSAPFICINEKLGAGSGGPERVRELDEDLCVERHVKFIK